MNSNSLSAPWRRAFLTLVALAWVSVSGAANLVVNPGFEPLGGVNGWQGFGTANPPIVSTSVKYRGKQSAFVTGRTATYMGLAQDFTGKVVPGVSYDIRAWVRLRQATPAVMTVGMKIVDDAGTRYQNLDWRSALTPGQWVKVGGYYRHQPTGTLRELKLYFNGPDAGIDFFVDQVSMVPSPAYKRPTFRATDFVRASGAGLVVGADAHPLRLLGVNFTAYGDDNETAEVVLNSKYFDHQEDFARARAAGMNSVRLNMWYKLFEDDANPYVYKAEGWTWLEKMLTWAGNAGVYLILDMHAPQCGYQSPDYTGAFWGADSACRDRLKALWRTIAQRYGKDRRIAAYDLLNEPKPDNNQQWVDYLEELVAEIRTVDPRHLILAEQSFAADTAPFLIGDGNVLYDFHNYTPWRYSSQLLYGYGYGDGNTPYPDAGISVPPWSYTARGLLENPALAAGTSDWTWHEGPIHVVTDAQAIAALPMLTTRTGTGRVWLDDFEVREYDPSGTETRRIHHIDIEKRPAEWYLLTEIEPFQSFSEYWTLKRFSGSTASLAVDGVAAHRGSQSLKVTGSSTGKAQLKNAKLTFAVRTGYGYRFSAWVKTEALAADSVYLGLQLQGPGSGEAFQPFVKATLEQLMLDDGLAFYESAGKPVNIGEFGQSTSNFQGDRGGLAWANDTLDIMASHNLSGQWFTWRGIQMGIHNHVYGYPDPAQANQPLLDLLQQKWSTP